MEQVKWVFVSNYINHHQIPFCDAMYELLGGSFIFIQTMEMEEERVRMGWANDVAKPYLKYAYREPEACQELIDTCEVLLFGGLEDEHYIQNRLNAGKIILRYSERMYKTGQWKAISPKGLRRKYLDHTRHRKKPVYMLCSGAYVPSDFHIFRAYPEKMYVWGYFPKILPQDVDSLIKNKGYVTPEGKTVPYVLWAGRFLDWKHPELAVETARNLKEKGLEFHMDIIGDGDERANVERLMKEYDLKDYVALLGFKTPEEVRKHMEQANVYLFTSDRNEGWGAVANEAMNSGCALVADHMIGAAPYMVRQGENGYLYQDKHPEMLYAFAEKLLQDRALCEKLGRAAYETVAKIWNPENAARQIILLAGKLHKAEGESFSEELEAIIAKVRETVTSEAVKYKFTPCLPAKVISERKMYDYLTN